VKILVESDPIILMRNWHIAINLLRNENTFNVSIRIKLKKKNSNASYVEKVLMGHDLS